MRSAVGTDLPWPAWARAQLVAAIGVAAGVDSDRPVAVELYERWFCRSPIAVTPRPLVGEYRRAHAGNAVSILDGLPVLERQDRIGRDGWWRTWNTSWRPRRADTRVLLSPRPDAVVDVVGELTGALRDVPYLLSCPTAAARLARAGSIVLHVPRVTSVPPGLLVSLATSLQPDTPPLCLPVAPGVAVAQLPDNGMSFGEHRCHLVAMALRRVGETGALRAIADVFLAHGVDPSAPHRTARGGG